MAKVAGNHSSQEKIQRLLLSHFQSLLLSTLPCTLIEEKPKSGIRPDFNFIEFVNTGLTNQINTL